MSAQQKGPIGRVLRMPLLYKILVANSAIVAIGAVAGTIITARRMSAFPGESQYPLIVFFASAGLILSFMVNYYVLKTTLTPLDRLQRGVEDVQSGKLSVRVDPGYLSDERFDRLASTFNGMLDTLERDARQLHELSGAILQAQEEERQRVARELHDETAQALTSLLVNLRLLERARSPEETRQQVQELRKLTVSALEEVRRVALELRPTILDDLGLEAALGWRVDELNAASATRVTLTVDGLQERLPREVELVFYRVAQEALSNIGRHSQAKNAQITLKQENGRLCLEVVDDGKGFDVAAAQSGPRRGLGLLGMRERLSLIGGGLNMESGPGGTRVRATAPVQVAISSGAFYEQDTCIAGR